MAAHTSCHLSLQYAGTDLLIMCCVQVFIEHQGGATGADLERELFIVRKLIEREKAALGAAADDFYICSLSNRTIVYKVRAETLSATEVAVNSAMHVPRLHT